MSDDLVEHLTALLATAIDVNERLTNERDRLREAIMFWLEAQEPDVDAAINMMRAALKGESHD